MSASEIILAIATAITTAATAWLAVHKANQLAMFRIERLEQKVDQHNGLDRRIVALEAEIKHLGPSRNEVSWGGGDAAKQVSFCTLGQNERCGACGDERGDRK